MDNQLSPERISEAYRIAEKVVRRYRRRSQDDFDDLVQCAVLAVCRRYGKFDARRSFRAWSYRVMANHVKTLLTKQQIDGARFLRSLGKVSWAEPDPAFTPEDIVSLMQEVDNAAVQA